MNLIKRNVNTLPSLSIWNDFFGNDWLNVSKPSFADSTMPAVNIIETNDHFNIELAVPGMKKNDFKIEVENGTLTISSEKEENKESKEGNYTRKEFQYHSFKRSFGLPKEIEGDRIAASYENGVLDITIPKKEEAKMKPSRMIEVA